MPRGRQVVAQERVLPLGGLVVWGGVVGLGVGGGWRCWVVGFGVWGGVPPPFFSFSPILNVADLLCEKSF